MYLERDVTCRINNENIMQQFQNMKPQRRQLQNLYWAFALFLVLLCFFFFFFVYKFFYIDIFKCSFVLNFV